MEGYYRNQRVLVTGGAGVIGSVLIEHLVGAGARVLCCDIQTQPARFGEAVHHIRGDANYLTPKQVADFEPSIVFHLAATFERSTETEEFWWENYWHNIRLSNHIMSLVKQVPGVKRVVFASSYLIYDPQLYSFDEARSEPCILSEDTPIYPRNICGAAKLLHELELRFLEEFDTYGFTTISARIFRVYGKGSHDIVSRWIRLLIKEPDATLHLYRGEGIFDYIYAGDVAEGLMRLGASPATGISNLGSGCGRKVFELVDALRSRFPDLRTESIEVDIPYEAHQADLTRLESFTGWRPTTSLEQGIDILIDHYRSDGVAVVEDERELGVLISSASQKVSLVKAFKSALKRTGQGGAVVAGDLNEGCIAGHFADGVWAMPRLDKLTVESLVAECSRRRITLIVPTRDGELDYYARSRRVLAEAGTFVNVAEPDQVRDCLDKLAFYHRCRDAGIEAIPTYASLADMGGYASIVVKERFGAGSRTIGIGLTRAQAERHAALLNIPIFQPYIDGQEYSIDLYVNRQGEVVEVVPRVRSQVFRGESAVTETVEAPALVEAAIALAQHFELRGHNVLQAFLRMASDVVFIECNPRVGGASTLSFQAGLDTPHWSLMEARGEYVAPRVGQYTRRLKLLRYSADRFLTV